MKDNTGQYRSVLNQQFHTAIKIAMDEVEDDVKRLLEYAQNIDTSDEKGMKVGIETIVCALKELARKTY